MEKLINLEIEYLKRLKEAQLNKEKFLNKVEKNYFKGMSLNKAMEISRREM